MRILIINPPHQSIGSRMPREMLPPLGLLAIGGPLIDDGHDVTLLDADLTNMALDEIARRACEHDPDIILIGHNGSTSAHPTIVTLLPLVRRELPETWIVYGGVFPTYHWREALQEAPEVDVVVRGEGEETVRKLIATIDAGGEFSAIPGLAFRDAAGEPRATVQAPMIARVVPQGVV